MSIPVAPGRLPLVGHLVQLFARPLQFLSSLRRVGELVRVDLGSAPMIMITDASLTRQVLLDSRTFEKGGPFFDRLSELCGESPLTSKSEPHRRQRRLIQPAFDQARIPGYAAVMAEAVDAVLGAWRDGAVVDMAARPTTSPSGQRAHHVRRRDRQRGRATHRRRALDLRAGDVHPDDGPGPPGRPGADARQPSLPARRAAGARRDPGCDRRAGHLPFSQCAYWGGSTFCGLATPSAFAA